MKIKRILSLVVLGGCMAVLAPVHGMSETTTDQGQPAATKSAPAKKKYRVKKTKQKAGSTATLESQEKNQEKRKSSLQALLAKMKKKISGAESKKNKLVAVASVRGDESSDTPPLYWKGKSSEGPVTMPELKEFDDAINTAMSGDSAGAKSKLESFVSTYPESPLKGDAQETLQALNSETPAP